MYLVRFANKKKFPSASNPQCFQFEALGILIFIQERQIPFFVFWE